ncbi:MAG: LysR family transcriptional regulator [Myxococcaceae bacterium]|nr:LysR family transcriptional regulator [Myxococcaceae bacterium]
MQNPEWSALQVLLEVHRAKTFLAAGRALGLSTSTVMRRVDALEASLGRRLVHRSAQGALLEKHALPLVEAAEAFERSLAAGQRDSKGSGDAGVVRVSVPDGFGPWLAPVLADHRRRHPLTEIQLISELRHVDLTAREADLAVRAGRAASPDLVAQLLGDVAPGLYASEGYLARALPKRWLGAHDYAEQEFVVEDVTSKEARMANVLVARGARRFPFCSNSFETRVRAAEEGMGLVLLAKPDAPRFPRLLPVDLETPIPGLKFYLTFHRQLRGVPRVMAVARAIFTASRAALATA